MIVTIERRDGSVEEMGVGEFTRWMCFVEALKFIEDKAEELNINVEGLIKPLAIDEYIKERYLCMKYDVEIELLLGNI